MNVERLLQINMAAQVAVALTMLGAGRGRLDLAVLAILAIVVSVLLFSACSLIEAAVIAEAGSAGSSKIRGSKTPNAKPDACAATSSFSMSVTLSPSLARK